jgi:hypothetical protein
MKPAARPNFQVQSEQRLSSAQSNHDQHMSEGSVMA